MNECKKEKKEGAFILDACCGSRMFWFDKQNPNVLFIDKRSETVEAKDSSQKSSLRTIEVKPDLIADFTDMPFEDEKFAMVVFDPPHLKTLGKIVGWPRSMEDYRLIGNI